MANFVTPITMYNATTRMHTVDVNISWSEPMSPNGVITSYEVTVAQTDSSIDVVYTNDSLTVTSVTQSVMVLPFTNYTVTVTASTSAGQGDPVMMVVLSPEAGKKKFSVLQAHWYLMEYHLCYYNTVQGSCAWSEYNKHCDNHSYPHHPLINVPVHILYMLHFQNQDKFVI